MSKLFLSPDLQLPVEAVTQTFGILAVKGAGKTNTGVVMVEELLERGQKVVIADPVGVWFGLRSTAAGDKAGYPIVIFGGDRGDLPITEADGEMVASALVAGKFSAILDFSNFRKNQQTRFMTDFAETLYRKNRTPIHFMIDEADAFAPQKPFRGQERMLGALEDIVRRGRARGIGCTMISQRPAVLNKNVLTQIEVLIVLRIVSPQDRDAIELWLEVNVEKAKRKEVMESLASLKLGEAWVWSPSWLSIFKRVQIRRRGTFDSSATPKVTAGRPIVITKADIDLDALGDQLAKARELAKATDPKLLQAEVHRLKSEVNRLQKQPLPPVQTKIPDDMIGTVQACANAMGDVVKTAREIHDASDRVWNMTNQLHGYCTSLVKKYKLHPKPIPGNPPARKEYTQPAPLPLNELAEVVQNHEVNLRKGERTLLEVLARCHPIRRTRSELGTLAGFAPSGGTFATYLSVLRKAGLIEEDNDGVFATDAGLEFLGADRPAMVMTSEAVQKMWMDRLRAGEAKMLEALLRVYPVAISREELAGIVDMEPTGGTFATYLSVLRRSKLIEDSGKGGVLKASPSLFIS